MSGILGKKIGMTSMFDTEGKNVPCTVIEAGPCIVTQVKTVETDGYNAIQLAFSERREKSTTNALKGHFSKANTSPKKKVSEFKDFSVDVKLGDVVKCDIVSEGIFCDVIGTSKGKGFFGNLLNSQLSGEAMVTRFSGKGKVYICSRNKLDFAAWVSSLIIKEKR